MPKKEKESVGNPIFILDKLDAPEKEWRRSVAKIFISNDVKLSSVVKSLKRLEKESVAILAILTAICIAVIKTALGL